MTIFKPVSPKAIRLWRKRMGWSVRMAADQLQLSRITLTRYEEVGAPLFIGLACAALLKGIKPILRVDDIKPTTEEFEEMEERANEPEDPDVQNNLDLL